MDKGNSSVDTEHEIKLEIKQECWLLIIASLVWIVDIDIKKETSSEIEKLMAMISFVYFLFKHK